MPVYLFFINFYNIIFLNFYMYTIYPNSQSTDKKTIKKFCNWKW